MSHITLIIPTAESAEGEKEVKVNQVVITDHSKSGGKS